MQGGAGAGAGLDGMQTAAEVVRTCRLPWWFSLGWMLSGWMSCGGGGRRCFPSRVVPSFCPSLWCILIYYTDVQGIDCGRAWLMAGACARARIYCGMCRHCVQLVRVEVVQGVQVLFLRGAKRDRRAGCSAVVVYRGGLVVKRCGRSSREGLSSHGGHVRGRRPSGRGCRRGVSPRPADRCPAGRRSRAVCSR